jgi:hypothetical protein
VKGDGLLVLQVDAQVLDVCAEVMRLELKQTPARLYRADVAGVTVLLDLIVLVLRVDLDLCDNNQQDDIARFRT